MQLDLFPSTISEDDTDEQVRHKTCYVCNESKPWIKDNFHIGASKQSGKVHLKGICKECNNRNNTITARLKKEYMHTKPNKCDCCDRPASEITLGLHLDHCYKTGKFRGWLCPQCNNGLGSLGDNIEGLERAIRYLERVK